MLATLLITLLSFLTPAALTPAAPPEPTPVPEKTTATTKSAAPSTPKHMEWTIDGVKREGNIYFPADTQSSPLPVVFAYHGHGGNARQAARSFKLHDQWPEAIVVYLQGLPTPGALTDPEGKRNGWQKTVGDQSDRDLKFFDAVLADLKKTYNVDASRIYATGHSNGGAFTYLLWSARADVFAALAPSSAGGNVKIMTSLNPKPIMHIAQRNDQLVKFSFQQLCIDRVRTINGCVEAGSEWAKDCTLYESKTGTPLVTMITDGSHTFNKNAPPLIVKFFKQHAKAGAPKPANAEPSPEQAPAPAPSTP